MHDASFLIPSRHRQLPPDDQRAQSLLRQRHEAATACLDASPTDLPWKFLADLAPLLAPPVLSQLPAPPGEVPLLNQIHAGVAPGLDAGDPASFARYLAAALFYFLPHELPSTPSPSQLPLWIRVPYLKWTVAFTGRLGDSGDAEHYARWLGRWRKVLAVDFAHGRGSDDLPEYQHRHLRRLVEEQLESGSRAEGPANG